MATPIEQKHAGADEPVAQGDLIVGPLRHPRNMTAVVADRTGQTRPGSIHDDATARKLGFRGGTIAGSVHMGQFPPVLTRVFGNRWWEMGSMSLYFRYATIDNEPVRCFAESDAQLRTAPAAQTRIWVEDTADHLVAEGTASVGRPDANSALRERVRNVPPAPDLRILAGLEVGKQSSPTPTRVDRPTPDELELWTEPLDSYSASPALVSPSVAVRLMRAGEDTLLARTEHTGVGLFGAIELQYLAGPVHAETDYLNTIRILAVGATPKTEYFWYEAELRDPANETRIATMLMMLRFMKASSALWQ